MELARGCMRNLIGCVLSASQSGVANNRGPRIKCVGAAYLFCEFQSITAATSLSGDIESVDSKVQNVLSTMFPSDLSKQPASAEMERLTLELDDLETHRQELVALEVEASVYLSCKY